MALFSSAAAASAAAAVAEGATALAGSGAGLATFSAASAALPAVAAPLSLSSMGAALNGLSPYFTAGGFALSALGARSQGIAAKNAADFQAGIARQQAERERQIGIANEEAYRAHVSRTLASRRALLAASGVEAGEGSPLAVSEDFIGDAELQALRIRNNAGASATRLEQEAVLQRISGRNARTAGYGRAGAMILAGIGDTFGGPGRTITIN